MQTKENLSTFEIEADSNYQADKIYKFFKNSKKIFSYLTIRINKFKRI